MSDIEIELWYCEEKITVAYSSYESASRMSNRTLLDNTVGMFAPHVKHEDRYTIVLSDKNRPDIDTSFVLLNLDIEQIEHQLELQFSKLIEEWRS